jgi:hypothetical protein
MAVGVAPSSDLLDSLAVPQCIFRCSSVKRLIPFPHEGRGSVQLEVEEEAGAAVTPGLHPSDVVETFATSFETTLGTIKPAAVAVALSR